MEYFEKAERYEMMSEVAKLLQPFYEEARDTKVRRLYMYIYPHVLILYSMVYVHVYIHVKRTTCMHVFCCQIKF